MNTVIKGVVLGVVLALLAGIVVWLAIAYAGTYNVAAADTHADVVRWTLETATHRSVASRADEVELPESFSRQQVLEGAAQIAAITAFVDQLPGLSAGDYAAMTGDGGGHHHGGSE